MLGRLQSEVVTLCSACKSFMNLLDGRANEMPLTALLSWNDLLDLDATPVRRLSLQWRVSSNLYRYRQTVVLFGLV